MRLHFSIGGYDYRRRLHDFVKVSISALLRSFLLIMCIWRSGVDNKFSFLRFQRWCRLFQLLMRYGQKVSQWSCGRLDCLILAHAFQNPHLALLKILLHAQQTCFASAFDHLIRLGNELLFSDPRVLLEDKIPVMGLGMVKHFRSNCSNLALSTRFSCSRTPEVNVWARTCWSKNEGAFTIPLFTWTWAIQRFSTGFLRLSTAFYSSPWFCFTLQGCLRRSKVVQGSPRFASGRTVRWSSPRFAEVCGFSRRRFFKVLECSIRFDWVFWRSERVHKVLPDSFGFLRVPQGSMQVLECFKGLNNAS